MVSIEMTPFRTLAIGGLCVAFMNLAGEAEAQCLSAEHLAAEPPPPIAGVVLASGPAARDGRGRMVAPMMVNGRGPFRFIVDTGANRSALSQRLADELGLTPFGNGEVHTIEGVSTAPLVAAQALQYSEISLAASAMPLLDGSVMGGQQGLLGVDGMRGLRLRMDFDNRCIELTASDRAPRLGGWTTLRGELRFGHLVLVKGRVENVPVNIFIDTGSDSTLANFALRDQLRGNRRVRVEQLDPARAYTAGHAVVLEQALALPRINMGRIEARDVLAYVGDFHIFHLWDLADEPSLLIGMDVLSQTGGVAVDYGRATVQFRLRQPRPANSRLSGQNRGRAASR